MGHKHYASLLGIFLCLMTGTAFADTIPAESKITQVTVFSDRATVTRRAEIELPAGAHTITFPGLPETLFPDSLRTEGKALEAVTIGALTGKLETHKDFVIPRIKELHDQLVRLTDQRNVIEAEKQAAVASSQFLDKIAEQATLRAGEELAEINLKPETWTLASKEVQTRKTEILKEQLSQDILIRAVDEGIRQINDELSRLQSDNRRSYSVTIPLEVKAKTKLTLDLVYQLPGASWQPVYDARLNTKTGVMQLVQYGSVWQQTGEDWKDVALTLSTAQPQRGAGLPDLQPFWINAYAPTPAYNQGAVSFNLSANMSGLQAPQADSPMAPAYVDAVEEMNGENLERAVKMGGSTIPVPIQEPEEARFVAAQINNAGFSAEYKIPGPSAVPQDGTQSKLMIGAFDVETSRQIQIKPQISTEAYLVIKTKLKGESPILPGEVSLFRDGAYIGQAFLPMLRPNDVEELAFGIDDKVRVKRNVLKDESSESGLITKDEARLRLFVTEIQNLHTDPISIAVLETIPVSQDQKIRVEVLPDTTKGYESDLHNIKGLLRWLQDVQPQQKYEVILGWKAIWPKGQSISGL